MCILDDFNDLLSQNEKRGRVVHPSWLLNGFREATRECGLIEDAVEEKLNRAMATSEWLDIFPNSSLNNLVAATSDHSPILCPPSKDFSCIKRSNFALIMYG